MLRRTLGGAHRVGPTLCSFFPGLVELTDGLASPRAGALCRQVKGTTRPQLLGQTHGRRLTNMCQVSRSKKQNGQRGKRRWC